MADIFETADVWVNLGGDKDNQVPLNNVTAGEIAVLQMLHGKDAITEIKPNGTVRRNMRAEKARLVAIYGRANDSEGKSILEGMYPGIAARVFQRINELELDAGQFKRGHVPADFVDNRAEIEKDIATGFAAAAGYEPEELPADDEPVDAIEPQPGDEIVMPNAGVSAVIDDGSGEETVTATDEAALEAELAAALKTTRGRKAKAADTSDVLA